MNRRALAVIALLLVGAAALTSCLLGGDGDDGPPPPGGCRFMGRTYEAGDRWPAGDNCNTCGCLDGEAVCTQVLCLDGGIDAAGACQPTQGCPSGPACGTICCEQGERCENGVCLCGSNPSCPGGDTCEAAGPIGGDACGAICCGTSGPCPQ